MNDSAPVSKYEPPHRVCRFLRMVRKQNGMSLSKLEQQHGLSAVVVGAYERGDRNPPLRKLEAALNVFGYRLDVVPIDAPDRKLPIDDVVGTLRGIANFLEMRAEAANDDDLHPVS